MAPIIGAAGLGVVPGLAAATLPMYGENIGTLEGDEALSGMTAGQKALHAAPAAAVQGAMNYVVPGGLAGQLETGLQVDSDPLQALAELGPTLLRFTTDEHAIIMNRAAVIDAAETGVLAEAIDEVARDSIYPLICALMERLVQTQSFLPDVQPDDAAQTYVALLFGEAQLRQALGTLPPFDDREMKRRSTRAFELTCKLYGAPSIGRRRAVGGR